MQLLAPNGKQSNLTPEQYKLVRTKAFKDWFGKYNLFIRVKNVPSFPNGKIISTSLSVDDDGSPKIWYHARTDDYNKFGRFWKHNTEDYGYFTETEKYAKQYGDYIKPFFVKCEKTLRLDLIEKQPLAWTFEKIADEVEKQGGKKEGKDYNILLKEYSKLEGDEKYLNVWEYFTQYNKLINHTNKWLSKYFDSVYYWEVGKRTKNNRGWNQGKILYVFGNDIYKRIKLADGTNTTFDGSNPDIRFMSGGNVLPDKYGAYKKRWMKLDYYGDLEISEPLKVEIYLFPNDSGFLIDLFFKRNLIGQYHSYFDKEDGLKNDAKIIETFKNKGLGKILLLVAIDVSNSYLGFFESDVRGLTIEQKRVYDSLIRNGQINGNLELNYEKSQELINKIIKQLDGNNSDIRYKEGGQIIFDNNKDNSGSIKFVLKNQEIGILKYYYDLDSSFSEELTKYSSELYIESVDVIKKYRGKGIATKLLKEVINFAKKLGINVVSLRRESGMGCDYGGEYDLYLKSIYERIGFIENNNECVMILELNKEFRDGGQILYHGTNQIFDNFSTNKLGNQPIENYRGTGVFEYGWGIYFTKDKDFALVYSYKDLSKNKNILGKDGEKPLESEFIINNPQPYPTFFIYAQNILIENKYNIRKIQQMIENGILKSWYNLNDEEYEWMKKFVNYVSELSKGKQILYTIKLSKNARLLNLDKKITGKELEKLQECLNKDKIKIDIRGKTGDEIVLALESYFEQKNPESNYGRTASLYLLKCGYDGSKYENYTVVNIWNDKVIEHQQREIFKGGGEIKNLVVLHNINPYQIEQSDKLGGLISPSIAILRAGDRYTDFGSITLIGNKDLINPETTSAKVYSGDVYSPSVPRKYYYVNKSLLIEKQKQLTQKAIEYDNISNSDREVYSLVSSSFGASSDFDKDLNKNDLDDLIRIYYDKFKIIYIVDKGIKIKIPQREKKHYLWGNQDFTLTQEQKIRFKPILLEYNKESNEKGSLGISKEIKSKVYDLLVEVFDSIIKERISKYEDDEKIKNFFEKQYRESFENNVGTRYNWGGWAEYNLSKAVYGEQILDEDKLKENIQKVFTPKIRKDYDTWLKNFISQFKGSAYFESGKSKLPYTLENLIDETTKSVVGQEKTLTFGVNKAKSFSFKKLNTIQEIKDNAGKLVSKDKMNEIDKENEKSFYNLASRLKYAYSSEWGKLDSLAKAIADFFKGKSAYSSLSKNDFINITNYDAERLKELANQLRKSPVDYFEAKLGRAVSLSEFKFAVVPEKTTKTVIDILKKNGLKIKKYSNDEQRMEIVNDIVNRNKLVFKQGGTVIKKPKSLSKTPAPVKERIYGSKINKPKSSESKEKAKSIILSDKVINSIKSIIEKHNKEFSNKKIPLETAKAVVRRGMGAYSSTHRPTISGGKPNSRVAWGLARLNAFVYKIQKGKSKSGKYKQDDDLIGELGYKVKNYENGGQITLSIQQIEQILGRKLHWWNDDIVYVNGSKYIKIFLQPFYKLV